MTFPGLPRAAQGFLADLAANNRRDWFEDNREAYQSLWLTPGLDLAAALSGPASDLGLLAIPKLNASLRRLHRDTRFSADKSPYTPRLHLILSTGPAFNKVPGVHLVLGPGGFGHGVGHWTYAPDPLARLRAAFCNPVQRGDFLAHLARAEATGAALDAPDLARLPKGYAPAPWDHLLRRKHIVLRTQTDPPAPDWLFTPDCLPRMTELLAALAPMAHWLARRL